MHTPDRSSPTSRLMRREVQGFIDNKTVKNIRHRFRIGFVVSAALIRRDARVVRGAEQTRDKATEPQALPSGRGPGRYRISRTRPKIPSAAARRWFSARSSRNSRPRCPTTGDTAARHWPSTTEYPDALRWHRDERSFAERSDLPGCHRNRFRPCTLGYRTFPPPRLERRTVYVYDSPKIRRGFSGGASVLFLYNIAMILFFVLLCANSVLSIITVTLYRESRVRHSRTRLLHSCNNVSYET